MTWAYKQFEHNAHFVLGEAAHVWRYDRRIVEWCMRMQQYVNQSGILTQPNRCKPGSKPASSVLQRNGLTMPSYDPAQ